MSECQRIPSPPHISTVCVCVCVCVCACVCIALIYAKEICGLDMVNVSLCVGLRDPVQPSVITTTLRTTAALC